MMKLEKALIKDVLDNRSNAVEALYDRFAPAMLSLCFRYTGNIQDAEDVLHEGFIKILKSLGDFKPRQEHSLEAWMKRIMTNTALNFLRDHSREKRILDIDSVREKDFILEDDDVGTDIYSLSVTQDQIMELIAALPLGYRTVFNLYVFEDHSHKEICEQLGCSENTSKSQLRKARALLRARIIEMANLIKVK
ncbi:MAG: RNA polymerase sigma factor [Bacteroidales bacterium]|nr:RNA polymerase sigma factor [Bacteroidales bacterium]